MRRLHLTYSHAIGPFGEDLQGPQSYSHSEAGRVIKLRAHIRHVAELGPKAFLSVFSDSKCILIPQCWPAVSGVQVGDRATPAGGGGVLGQKSGTANHTRGCRCSAPALLPTSHVIWALDPLALRRGLWSLICLYGSLRCCPQSPSPPGCWVLRLPCTCPCTQRVQDGHTTLL